MTDSNRVGRIRAALEKAFAPQRLVIEDESHQHAGHTGAASGLGHFHVEIVSSAFSGQSLLARHRLVYATLGDLMNTDIHALSITAKIPAET